MGLLLLGAASIGLWQWSRLETDAPAVVAVKQTWRNAIATIGLGQSSDTAEAQDPAAPTAISVTPLEGAEESDSVAVPTASAAEETEPGAQTNPQPGQNRGSATADPNKAPAEAESKPDTLLNHRRYEVVPTEDLVTLNPNSALRLQPAAQAAVNAMLTKAKIEGVQLGVISAHRTLEDQSKLYFDIKAERGQDAKTRAEVSAPPGYSEHHTGYAVDFIDEGLPNTHLSQSFETTPAFQWLERNAPFFNFELSFPKDGDSGVSYEPWHWRFVGDQKSLELFYKE